MSVSLMFFHFNFLPHNLEKTTQDKGLANAITARKTNCQYKRISHITVSCKAVESASQAHYLLQHWDNTADTKSSLPLLDDTNNGAPLQNGSELSVIHIQYSIQ